jgi:phage repressor protein C with HTH and peptisase S24 domain
MSLAERLKKVRNSLGKEQKDVADALGISFRSWQDYEAGKSVPGGKVFESLTKLGFNANWLLTGEGNMRREEFDPELDRMVAAADRIDAIHEMLHGKSSIGNALETFGAAEGYVQVPRYKVQASAGGGSVIHSEQIVDFLSFRADWIHKTLGLSEKDLALINVLGDSMEPTLSNDDVILIDMGKKGIHDNSVYVLHFNGVLLVKRIQRKLDGSVIVKSDNMVYEPEVIRGDMLDTLNVVGRVVWCGRRM